MFYSRTGKQFFYAMVYGLMYHKMEDASPISKLFIKDAEKVLGKDIYFQLKKLNQM